MDLYEEVNIPITVLGELYLGAYYSINTLTNLEKIEKFRQRCVVLFQDLGTAKRYGLIKSQLFRNGHPIPENDIWIAALAIENNIRLACRDQHYSLIEELDYEQW